MQNFTHISDPRYAPVSGWALITAGIGSFDPAAVGQRTKPLYGRTARRIRSLSVMT